MPADEDPQISSDPLHTVRGSAHAYPTGLISRLDATSGGYRAGGLEEGR
jgi:hypothetical protein